MKISNLQTKFSEGQVTLSADFSYKSINKTVFFETALENKDLIASDYSVFFPIGLVTAMTLGEDLYVDGTLSQKLYDTSADIQSLVTGWNIGFKRINVRAKDLLLDRTQANNIGSFFSCGVDSFFTYLRNREQMNEKINHIILVHGFDVELEDHATFDSVKNNAQAVADEEKIKLIVIRTNMRELLDPILYWGHSFGAALGSMALFLRTGLKQVFIPSSTTFDTLYPWGSHPDFDPLWSTESLEIIHEGCDTSRVEKTRFVSQYPIALKYLRVCWHNLAGKYNCGLCPKCLRTMIDLSIAGALGKAKTFDKELNLKTLRKADARKHSDRVYYEQSLHELEKNNTQPELQAAIKYILYEKKYFNFFPKTRQFLGRLDAQYNRNRLYDFLFRHGLIS